VTFCGWSGGGNEQGEVSTPDALAVLGIALNQVRRRIEANFGRGALDRTCAGAIPFTPRSKQALQLAVEEADALGHDYVGTEHLLLGVARADRSVGSEILRDRGVDPITLREAVLERLNP
jgi:ATP-dependent Clp protease ATP-binding subunit ClpC